MKKSLLAAALAAPVLWLASPAPVSAIVFEFQAEDLFDGVPGRDLWRYTYRIRDFTFDRNVGFSVLFAPGLYASLESPPPPVNPDWSVLTLQPEPAIPDPGRYDVLALVPNASLADPFTVEFIWLGGNRGTPGAQTVDIGRFDEAGRFLGDVMRLHTVPQPGAIELVVGGLLGWAAIARGRLRTWAAGRAGKRSASIKTRQGQR